MSYNDNNNYYDPNQQAGGAPPHAPPAEGYYQQQPYDDPNQPPQQEYYNPNAQYYQQPYDMDGYQEGGQYEVPNQQIPQQGYNDQFSEFSQTPGTPGYDQYGTQYTPSQISYGGDPRSSGASTPIYGGQGQGYESAQFQMASNLPYPAWSADPQAPVKVEHIEDIFIDLTNKFGFQRDSMRNMFDYFMTLLDSRSSRMTPAHALLSLHADYIGGDNANYKKWFFASQQDLDDSIGFANMRMGKLGRKARKASKKSKKVKKAVAELGDDVDPETLANELEGDFSLEAAEIRWKAKMNALSPEERVRDIALYLLLWGEANQVRFTPETLCYIYKTAFDYLQSPACQQRTEAVPEGDYLQRVITPLYRFLRSQVYEIYEGKFVKREKDHNKIIGYDDVNQLFWYPEGISRIIFNDGSRLVDVPKEERYLKLGEVEWTNVFFKTYKEIRTWLHFVTNFNRIWIIHGTIYWMYVSYNAPTLYTLHYQQTVNQQPTASSRWAAASIGGSLATLIQIFATLFEWMFVPREWAGAQHLSRRLVFLIIILLVNAAPPVYTFYWAGLASVSKSAYIVSIVGFFIAVVTLLFFAVMPLGGLFTSYMNKRSRRYLASQAFTANFIKLKGLDMWMSYLLWLCVFIAKLSESYFFLILSIRDPIRILSTTTMRCVGEVWFGVRLCQHQAQIVLGLMFLVDLLLFFLDTYMWYILCNCIFSIGRSFYLGISILTPWRNIFTRLPKRIYSKILATTEMEVKYKPKVLISQIWNAVVISMYREHLLAIDHVQKLLYHQVPSEVEGKRTLRAPTFFISQDDNNFETEFFPRNSEAERRISFFAQSLATPIPEPLPVDNMPTFTVFTPHYSEKILLSLKEIIREDDEHSKVTLLEYLKQLHPVEWDCFVKDTKILAEETAAYENGGDSEKLSEDGLKSKIDDLPFYCVGFKSSAPEYTLRTRIWASLRSQTLYRTVSGFMNYARAIKLLYRVENPELVQYFGGDPEGLELALEKMARRKFRFLVSMQRKTKFKEDEKENAEFLLRAYPDLQIAYLDEEAALNEGEDARIYSAVVDGHCEMLENGERKPKFRVQLSGNPILGDGKSDNQNHAVIFHRGEYIQLVDANQDNYLEECLKIRSVLAEFEELNLDFVNPYEPDLKNNSKEKRDPVAFLGAREYIFSENSGVLGDVAAGKEQTFGTLFARTLAQIGGKLHYGHPDFLNATFMLTRGGVSKAQKGLHLNEDIYAGMTAMLRGGKIKHCEYYQCGKGRDMGFGSILNFTTKIGAGMGEQMLSREYYYLSTQLPLDRFLSFYYGHPGFHINNLFIQFSLQAFILVLANLTSLAHESIICAYNKNSPITDVLFPFGCYNLSPAVDWVRRYTLSIFIVFFISFIPLVVQELIERGVWKAFQRFVRHFASLSPMFEVFVAQIYSSSIYTDLTVGGARYISTGRGFATSRIPFSILYSRFADSSIYMGARLMLILLFGSVAKWQAPLLWFWASLSSLMFSPFIFNPHQFSWDDFFVDYRDFIIWLSRGNTKWYRNSWIGYIRLSRSRITGFKRKLIGNNEAEQNAGDASRAHRSNVFFADFLPCLFYTAGLFVAFTFINAQTGVTQYSYEIQGSSDPIEVNSTLRVVICALAPVVINMGVLGVCFALGCCAGPMLGLCCKKTGSVLAGVAHGISVIINLVFFIVMWVLEGFVFARMLLGVATMIYIQRLLFKFLTLCFLTREFKNDRANSAFWNGKWYGSGMGYMALTQPAREFCAKIIEMSHFAGDFVLAHIILFCQLPILCIPLVDRWHTTMLFWLKPSRLIRQPIFTVKKTKLRKRIVRRYCTLYFFILVVFVVLIAAPAVASSHVPSDLGMTLTGTFKGLFQPRHVSNNDTGPNRPSHYTWSFESTRGGNTKPYTTKQF